MEEKKNQKAMKRITAVLLALLLLFAAAKAGGANHADRGLTAAGAGVRGAVAYAASGDDEETLEEEASSTVFGTDAPAAVGTTAATAAGSTSRPAAVQTPAQETTQTTVPTQIQAEGQEIIIADSEIPGGAIPGGVLPDSDANSDIDDPAANGGAESGSDNGGGNGSGGGHGHGGNSGAADGPADSQEPENGAGDSDEQEPPHRYSSNLEETLAAAERIVKGFDALQTEQEKKDYLGVKGPDFSNDRFRGLLLKELGCDELLTMDADDLQGSTYCQDRSLYLQIYFIKTGEESPSRIPVTFANTQPKPTANWNTYMIYADGQWYESNKKHPYSHKQEPISIAEFRNYTSIDEVRDFLAAPLDNGEPSWILSGTEPEVPQLLELVPVLLNLELVEEEIATPEAIKPETIAPGAIQGGIAEGTIENAEDMDQNAEMNGETGDETTEEDAEQESAADAENGTVSEPAEPSEETNHETTAPSEETADEPAASEDSVKEETVGPEASGDTAEKNDEEESGHSTDSTGGSQSGESAAESHDTI